MASASISQGNTVRAPSFWSKLKGSQGKPSGAGDAAKTSAPVPTPASPPTHAPSGRGGNHYYPSQQQPVLVQPARGSANFFNDDAVSVASDDTAPTAPYSNSSSANSFLSQRQPDERPQTFYVPLHTPSYVSCGDGNWHFGLWGDNHRTVSSTDANALRLSDCAVPPRMLQEVSQQPTFIRYADVLLLDGNGRPMFMAANRKRPCLIRFPPTAALYVEQDGSFTPVTMESM